MGKRSDIKELVIFLSLSLSHRIGSIVNPDEIYSGKYGKELDAFLKKASKIYLRQNWNNEDKANIKKLLKKKLNEELERRSFLDEKKFLLIEEEVEDVLKYLEEG